MTQFKSTIRYATFMAEKVYKAFLADVINQYVLEDREETVVSEDHQNRIKKGTHIDPRPVRLITISGKGGLAKDPKLQSKYDCYYNTTILDHLLSVTRGALIFAAVDMVIQNKDIDDETLEEYLTVIVAIAFSHDNDKVLQLKRDTALSVEDVESLMNKYGIFEFLKKKGISITPNQLRFLIEKVEAGQSHRHVTDVSLKRNYEVLPNYVRIADKADSLWLFDDPEKGRIKGVMDCLDKYQGVLHSDFLKRWSPISLYDPHHPFLLDELQRWLSMASRNISEIPPLLELHQDGHLFMLLPNEDKNEIIKKGISYLCNWLPFKLKLDVSNRGVPSFYYGKPSYSKLLEFFENPNQDVTYDLLKIKREMVEEIKDPLFNLLSEIGIPPIWPKKMTGELIRVYSTLENIEGDSRNYLNQSALISMMLNLKIDSKKKDSILNYKDRERVLLETIGKEPPSFIATIHDDKSRRSLIALWATVQTVTNKKIYDDLLGENGLFRDWLEGNKNQKGFNQFFEGDGEKIIKAITHRLHSLLSGKRVAVDGDNQKGHCLFTDEPVPFTDTIREYLGLYEVKVSAFSGRENRPEKLIMGNGQTHLSPTSIAEHLLRKKAHALQGGYPDGVPNLITSPTTAGLFGGLAVTDDKNLSHLSVFDISRLELKKGKVMKGIEHYNGRFRVGRLEKMPDKLKEKVGKIRMFITATRRLGRPIHIFQGLPSLKKHFFYYDAMPKVLEALLGGKGLYLEGLQPALKKLNIAENILSINGLGYETLKLYTQPNKRFSALCFLVCYFKNHKNDTKLASPVLYTFLSELEETFKKGGYMSDNESALVHFAKMATGIQKNPGPKASINDTLLVFKICLDTVIEAYKNDQTDDESLILAVAGELERNLVRKGKAASKQWRNGTSLLDECHNVANIFIRDIWFNVLKGKNPSQRSKRILSSIYRVSFLMAQKDKNENNPQN